MEPAICGNVPERTPALFRLTVPGRVPASLKVGAGVPVAVTVKVLASVAVNVALSALVIVGAIPTPMAAVTDWWSTVAVAPPFPVVTPAVYVIVAVPEDRVLFVGATPPRVLE